MTTYMVTYDLVNESGSQDYEPLWDSLKEFDAVRTQESVWLVNLNNTAREVHDHFKKFMDSDDRLWVFELTKNHSYSKALNGTNDWLSKNPPAR